MGKYKTRDKHLPPRLRLIRGRYYYIRAGKQEPLGDDYVRALLKWRELEGEHDSGESVSSMLDSFLAGLKGKAESTFVEYTRGANVLARYFKGFAMADVKPSSISRFLECHEAAVQANRQIAVLSAAFERARRIGRFDGPNPCAGVKRNKEKKRKHLPDAAELKALTEPSTLMGAAAELAKLTGLREQDIRLMTFDQIQEEGVYAKPRKTINSTEAIIIFAWTSALKACVARAKLLRRRVGCRYLFPNREGGPYTLDGWQSQWQRHKKTAGVTGVTFHDLRRWAINEVQRTRGKEAAQAFATHASMKTTEGYLANVGATVVAPTG